MINRFLCWHYGHDYDRNKYRSDLTFHSSLDRMKEFAEQKKSKQEVIDFLNNPPLPFCKRCQKEIPL